MRTLLSFAAVLAIAVAAGAAAQMPPSAADLAARIQARYATIRDFTADFTLTQTSALLPKPVIERGEVKVKKPGRMRWTYTSSDKKVFVSDGTRFFSYFPQDRFVDERRLPTDRDSSTALLFLAGRADLARDFVPSVPASQPNGEWQLILAPKTAQADFKTLTLDVDHTSLALRGFTVFDDQGGVSTFRFARLQENRGLNDSEFTFTIPRGVEVRRQ